VRGSRRSIATRPLGIAPDASRSRRLRYEKAAGPFAIPSASEGSARIPNSSVWSGSPHGGPDPMEVLLFPQPTCRRRPNYVPGSLQGQAQAHLSADDPSTGLPPGPTAACPIRRPAQGRERIDRKAGLDERRLAFHPVCVLRETSPRQTHSASNDWRPLREAIARGFRMFSGAPRLHKAPGQTEAHPRDRTTRQSDAFAYRGQRVVKRAGLQ
jgi:hypothetical protein